LQTDKLKKFLKIITMKKSKKLFSPALVLLIFLGINKAEAQAPITVIQGSTHTYSVTPVPNGASYDYVWTISGGTNSIPGTGATTAGILWDGIPGQYSITVYPVNPATGCAGNNQMLLVNVVAMGGFTLTGPATVCPHTDNQSGNFDVTITYTGTGAWSYILNDGSTNRTVNVADGTGTSTTGIIGFANLSNTTQASHVIRVTSVTTPEGTVTYDGTEANATNHRITVNVQPTPATSGIIAN
jgi:hypothetical protein